MNKWFEETYQIFSKNLQELEQGKDVSFMAVGGLMDLLMIWDKSGEILKHNDYSRAISAMNRAARNQTGIIRDNWMKEIAIISEKYKTYFDRRAA